jgi:hypothetical protein
LANGLSINSSGHLVASTVSGSAAAATNYTVTVTDANGVTATATMNLTVSSSPTATQAIASKTQAIGDVASFTPVTGSGGLGPLTYSISPALTNGLSMSASTGVITGSVTSYVALASYTITVTDANSVSATQTFQYSVPYTVGQSILNLGSYGQLIYPVLVNGKTYYYWDRNGDGVANDFQTYSNFSSLFSNYPNGVINGVNAKIPALYLDLWLDLVSTRGGAVPSGWSVAYCLLAGDFYGYRCLDGSYGSGDFSPNGRTVVVIVSPQ